MGNALITLGLFLWFLFSIIPFAFHDRLFGNTQDRLKRSIKIDLGKSTGIEFGKSLMQVTGIIWIVTGAVVDLIGESFFEGVRGDVFYSVVFLAPVWIGAFIVERRRNKRY